jgi:lysophospholipase L1-like esterase
MRVVALGDSVTVGVGDHVAPGADAGWAAHLAEIVGASSYTNLARTGARARDVVADQLPRALALAPDLATVLVGGHDVLRADFDAERVGRQARATVSALADRGALVLVVLLHDPSRCLPRGGGVFGRVVAARASLVSQQLRAQLAGIEGVVVLDPEHAPQTYDRASWHIDRMHPSALGHRLLGAAGAAALAPYGIVALRPPPPAPEVPGGVLAQAAWLVRNGVPWFAKRSLDLVPELVRVVVSERSAYAAAR